MKYLFHQEAGQPCIVLRGETFKYIIKVRRHRNGDRIDLRHPDRPEMRYGYTLLSAEGRQAELALEYTETSDVAAARPLHIGWCLIDPKSVEKVLPQLNETGVAQITFIRCTRSQKPHTPDMARLERILESSMQQCGRSRKMRLEHAESVEAFLDTHPETVVLDFCDTVLTDASGIETVLIGCEGGFSEEERRLLAGCPTFRFDTPMVLRSETAAVAAAAKILL